MLPFLLSALRQGSSLFLPRDQIKTSLSHRILLVGCFCKAHCFSPQMEQLAHFHPFVVIFIFFSEPFTDVNAAEECAGHRLHPTGASGALWVMSLGEVVAP